jgi:hypothetical protein
MKINNKDRERNKRDVHYLLNLQPLWNFFFSYFPIVSDAIAVVMHPSGNKSGWSSSYHSQR